MITLLLTLFISLFSVCPSNYQVEDHNENNNYLASNQHFVEKREMDNMANQSYTYRFYNVFEIFNIYNYPNYLQYATSDFWNLSNTNVNSVAIYHLSDTAYIMNYTELDFVSDNFPCSNNSIAFDTIEFRLTNKSGSVGGVTEYTIDINFYYIKGVNQGAVFTLGEVYLNNNYYAADNPKGITLTYGNNYRMYAYYFVELRTHPRQINEFFDLFDIYNVGYADGESAGYQTGYSNGYQSGYSDALQDFEDVDSTAFTIFSGILDVGLLPVNVFLAILNFDVFGINISGFVSALLTVSIVIIIVRFLFGGKNNDK